MQNEGITIAPVPPTTVTKTVLSFPISGGKIAVTKFVGTLNHRGGLTFTHNGKSVKVTDLVLDTQTKQATATVGGKSLPFFDLNLASFTHATEPLHTVVASNITLTLTSDAASAGPITTSV
jgi:hypothetical protein